MGNHKHQADGMQRQDGEGAQGCLREWGSYSIQVQGYSPSELSSERPQSNSAEGGFTVIEKVKVLNYLATFSLVL